MLREQEWAHLLSVEKAAYQAYASLVRLAETVDAAPEVRQQIDQILLNWRPEPEPDWRLTPDLSGDAANQRRPPR